MTEEVMNSTITCNDNNNDNVPANDTNNIVKQPQLTENSNEERTIITTKEKKKQGAFSFLKVASLKLRRRSIDLKEQKFPKAEEPTTESKGDWKKLVGSMRPLHLQDNQSPPPPNTHMPPAKSPLSAVECHEIVSSPYSPSPSTSSGGTMSQYASANNLQDLYGQSEDEEEDPDHVFDAIGADDMIDAKAENFIAQFYEQMRRQQ